MADDRLRSSISHRGRRLSLRENPLGGSISLRLQIIYVILRLLINIGNLRLINRLWFNYTDRLTASSKGDGLAVVVGRGSIAAASSDVVVIDGSGRMALNVPFAFGGGCSFSLTGFWRRRHRGGRNGPLCRWNTHIAHTLPNDLLGGFCGRRFCGTRQCCEAQDNKIIFSTSSAHPHHNQLN